MVILPVPSSYHVTVAEPPVQVPMGIDNTEWPKHSAFPIIGPIVVPKSHIDAQSQPHVATLQPLQAVFGSPIQ